MNMLFRLSCTSCEWEGDDQDITGCPQCGKTIEVVYQSTSIAVDDQLPGLWRYVSHLPIRDTQHIISLGEGHTPLLKSARLGMNYRVPELYFKMESANPTGSYKDRIATVGISRLIELGKVAWAATSSGNAGAAIAAYGARAGLRGYLFTLEKASKAKVAQILSYRPEVRAVERLGYDPEVENATWANIMTRCKANNWMMMVTARAFNPHAMEGAKTIAFELCEQLQGEAPDVVYIPVGGGGVLSTVWKGFVEWHLAGNIDRLPRLVAVQASGCDPVTQAWEAKRPIKPIPDCGSTISGIQLTAPPDGDLVLRALKESHGWAISVPDEATYEAQSDLAGREGLFVEPAAAITWAGVQADLQRGRLEGHERVVCLLTGTGFKDMNAIQNMVADRLVPMITAQDILTQF